MSTTTPVKNDIVYESKDGGIQVQFKLNNPEQYTIKLAPKKEKPDVKKFVAGVKQLQQSMGLEMDEANSAALDAFDGKGGAVSRMMEAAGGDYSVMRSMFG